MTIDDFKNGYPKIFDKIQAILTLSGIFKGLGKAQE